MKIIVAGGRDFRNYPMMEYKLDKILINIDSSDIEIVSGHQSTRDNVTGEIYGADYLGEQYAIKRGYRLKAFPADWYGLGKKAGPLRNEEMAKYADAAVVFFDGKSRGSHDMITRAEQHNLKLRIIKY